MNEWMNYKEKRLLAHEESGQSVSEQSSASEIDYLNSIAISNFWFHAVDLYLRFTRSIEWLKIVYFHSTNIAISNYYAETKFMSNFSRVVYHNQPASILEFFVNIIVWKLTEIISSNKNYQSKDIINWAGFVKEGEL